MLLEEAEREAERRNLEDPDRARYEFYVFDESAGLAADAWQVSARLREGPPPTAEWPATGPQTPAGGAPAREAPRSRPPPSPEPAPVESAYPEPLPYEEEPLDQGRGHRRAGLVIRSFGAIVMLVGVLWMAMVVVLAGILKPGSLASVGLFVIAGVLGFFAVALGLAIRRS
jgi:hypothetical protein